MPTWTVPAMVVSVVDGDTVHLDLDLGWKIRYTCRARIAMINAPEMGTEAGRLAKEYAERLLPARGIVQFISHSLDKYGRPLGRIRDADGKDFGTEMINAGHAMPMKE